MTSRLWSLREPDYWSPAGNGHAPHLHPMAARRTREVDATILGSYLAGANTRRTRLALAPLLGEAHLSKSAVSRVVVRLRALFERGTSGSPRRATR
jgi:Transposase, Mutator family